MSIDSVREESPRAVPRLPDRAYRETPPAPVAARVAWLQRTIGNHATSRVLRDSLSRSGVDRRPVPAAEPRVAMDSATPASAASATLIVSDTDTPAPGQMRQQDAVAALQARVMAIADAVLARIGQDASSCVYLDPAFKLYASRGPAFLEQAIERFAPGALAGGDLRAAIDTVAARATTAFEAFVEGGSFRGVPEEVREAVHGTTAEPRPVAPPVAGHLTPAERPVLQGCWPWGSRGQTYAPLETEMDVVSTLPDWGGATFLGYHAAAKQNWRLIRQGGQFNPGGGIYGTGIYIVDDPKWLNVYGSVDRVLLEVGYVGLPPNLTVQANANRKELPAADSVDLVEGNVPFPQKCYWLGGPSQLIEANFRVREAPRT